MSVVLASVPLPRRRLRWRLALGAGLALGVLTAAALASRGVVITPLLLQLVIAPVLEEIVFRGGVQDGLLRRHGDAHAARANLLTAVAFAAAHVVLRPTLASALTLLPALAIGWIYQRRRRIAPCIAAHAACNAIGWLCQPAELLLTEFSRLP